MAQGQQKMGGKRWFCGWYKEVIANGWTTTNRRHYLQDNINGTTINRQNF
jgi:hypothetical protein